MNTTIKTCRKRFVTNIFEGIHLRGINDKNFSVRHFKKELQLTPIQSSAADIIRLAMIKIDKILEKKKIAKMLQIHDELIFECLKDESKVKNCQRSNDVSFGLTITCFLYL